MSSLAAMDARGAVLGGGGSFSFLHYIRIWGLIGGLTREKVYGGGGRMCFGGWKRYVQRIVIF